MTHFSLKSTALAVSFLTVSISISAFAAPAKTECTTDPLFAANTCEVCYIDTYTPTKIATGWTAELEDMQIPWDHSGIELQEVILESNQKIPEMIMSPNLKVTPAEAEKIWEFSPDIVWYDVGDDREYFIEKGESKVIYTFKADVKLALSGSGAKDFVLTKTPLLYEEYNKDLNQSTTGKSRNICVLNTFYTGSTPPPVVVTPPPAPTPEVTPLLNAAGPEEAEEVEAEEKVTPKITPEQTETKAGPGMWIFLLLAFVFSSAWTAWKKQKI